VLLLLFIDLFGASYCVTNSRAHTTNKQARPLRILVSLNPNDGEAGAQRWRSRILAFGAIERGKCFMQLLSLSHTLPMQQRNVEDGVPIYAARPAMISDDGFNVKVQKPPRRKTRYAGES
jgi:hypothetical protein